jgi:hypothetical protein
MNDEDLVARYEQRGVPTEWQEITPPALAPAFRLLFRALPSPKSPDNLSNPPDWLIEGAQEAELLIHDPLTALRQAGIDVEEDARISTIVVNHEKTLERFIMHAVVVASTNPRTIGITLVKEPE